MMRIAYILSAYTDAPHPSSKASTSLRRWGASV